MKRGYFSLLTSTYILLMIPIVSYCTTYNLVSQYSYYYYSSDVNYNYSLNYHYSPVNHALIDSISNDDIFTHSLHTDVNNEILTYSRYDAVGNLKNYYKFVTDQNGDMLELYMLNYVYHVIPDSVHYYFHYIQPGQPDSIEIIQSYSPYHSYHILAYDGENRLVSSTKYENVNNAWVPNYKYEFSYSPSSIQYPMPLDFNITRMRSLLEGTEFFGCLLDKRVKPDIISYYNWNSQTGWQQQSPFLGVTHSSGITEIWGGGYIDTYRFNASGLCTGYSDPGYMQYGYGCGLSWFSITPNDEQVITPTPDFSISAYPNPFKASINIKTNNKAALDDISIYNIKGQLIRSWKDVKATELTWDGKDSNNSPVSSGVYLIRAKQGDSVQTIKAIRM